MNSVEPMNCSRSISGLSSGTARFSPRPAKNAPTMASIPAASASTPPTRNAAMPNTNRYERSVPTRAKNQRATLGSPSSDQTHEHGQAEPDPAQLHAHRHPGRLAPFPRRPTTPAAPTCRSPPSRRRRSRRRGCAPGPSTGATDRSPACASPSWTPSAPRPPTCSGGSGALTMPSVKGIANDSSAKVIAAFFIFMNSLRSSSSPALNMR